MQVNGVRRLAGYMTCLRTHPGEAGALLQDLLISRDQFLPRPRMLRGAGARTSRQLFEGKGPSDTVRVWVPACATGEEAYSIAMLLIEHARTLEAPPLIQIFAMRPGRGSDPGGARGHLPDAIEADVSEERLRRYFVKEQRGYRVRRELREMVLFATHDLLKDAPFSRLDLISCRNLLIYLNREAQARVLDIFHFALLPGGTLFLGSSESVEDGSPLFRRAGQEAPHLRAAAEPRGRRCRCRPARHAAPGAGGPGTQLAGRARVRRAALSTRPRRAADARRRRSSASRPGANCTCKLLERFAPPSVLVDREHDIVHLSANAGRFLQFAGGEPTRNLLRVVHPELAHRTAGRAVPGGADRARRSTSAVCPWRSAARRCPHRIRVIPADDVGADLFLVI